MCCSVAHAFTIITTTQPINLCVHPLCSYLHAGVGARCKHLSAEGCQDDTCGLVSKNPLAVESKSQQHDVACIQFSACNLAHLEFGSIDAMRAVVIYSVLHLPKIVLNLLNITLPSSLGMGPNTLHIVVIAGTVPEVQKFRA